MVAIVQDSSVKNIDRPPRYLLAQEVRDLVRAMREGRKPHVPSGEPTLTDLPFGEALYKAGFFSPPSSFVPAIRHARSEGIPARQWSGNINQGPTRRNRALTIDDVQRGAAVSGRGVVAVGWSLGGMDYSDIAYDAPDLFHHVLTMGSPIALTIDQIRTHTNLGAAYAAMQRLNFLYNWEVVTGWRPLQMREPIDGVMFSQILPLYDGVVSLEGQRLPFRDGCRTFVVPTTHAGVVTDPTSLALKAHLIRYGNEGKIPLSIGRGLRSLDSVDAEQDRRRTYHINGGGVRAALSEHRAQKRGLGSVHVPCDAMSEDDGRCGHFPPQSVAPSFQRLSK